MINDEWGEKERMILITNNITTLGAFNVILTDIIPDL